MTSSEPRHEAFETGDHADQTRHMLRKSIQQVSNVSAHIPHSTCVTIKRETLRLMEEWFNEFLWFNQNVNDISFLSAIREEMDAGRLVIADIDDVDALHFGFVIDMCPPTEMMEHYVRTGEFIEVLKLLRSTAEGMADDDVVYLSFEKLKRLYTYDMSLIQESAAEDRTRGNADSVASIPLEIRAEFSGFYDTEDTAEGTTA